MIESRPAELDTLFNRYAGEPVAAPSLVTDRNEWNQPDKDLFAKIAGSKQGEKFKKLFSGDWQKDYESQSEADLALCSILAFWCQKDSEQMDRIFCESKLYRDKWEEKRGPSTYGQITIQKAIDLTKQVHGEGKSQISAQRGYNRQVFRLVQAGKIEAKPPQWLVYGLIELDCLALVFGDPACGKSLWAIAVALCVSTGTSFYGHKVKQGPVIYIAGEGQNGLARRMMAWSNTNRVPYKTAPLFLSLIPAAFTDNDMLTQVQEAIDFVSAEHGPPVLIVIDTLARNFGPGDENSTQDMSKFIQASDTLRASSKATVLIVHHSGHSDKGRARGAMALKGALDSEYRLDKDETGTIRLKATKMKDSKYPELTAYRIMTVDLPLTDEDNGDSVRSAVLELTRYEPPPAKGKAGRGKHQARAMGILKELHKEVRNNCAVKGQDLATARVSTDEWKKAMKDGGIPQQRIADVVNSLAAAKMITEEGGFVSPL